MLDLSAKLIERVEELEKALLLVKKDLLLRAEVYPHDPEVKVVDMSSSIWNSLVELCDSSGDLLKEIEDLKKVTYISGAWYSFETKDGTQRVGKFEREVSKNHVFKECPKSNGIRESTCKNIRLLSIL